MERVVTALFEYSFLCFVFLAMGFLFGYVLRERHAAKKRQYELEEANKTLELHASLGRSVTEFCHEIGNHIVAIRGGIISLETKIDVTDPEIEETVKALNQATQDMINIVKGFKNAVRGHFDDSKRWVLLQDVIEPMILSQTNGAFKKLRIETECRCNHYWYASPRIAEAFLNLIINACESMEKAHKKRLSAVAGREDGCLVVHISDSGRGIPPEAANRVFEYGFTTKSDGSGQGMSITKQIVEENGGTISFESNVDTGTTFTIRFEPQKIKTPRVPEG